MLRHSVHYYDGVVSLGVNCCSAAQCQLRGLRTESGPFDWIGLTTEAYSPLEQIRSWLEAGCETILATYDFIPPVTASVDLFGYVNVHDRISGYDFPHDFMNQQPSAMDVLAVREILRKRGRRLCFNLSKGGDWLLVVNGGGYSLSVADLRRFLSEIRPLFPKARLSLFVVFFHSEEDRVEAFPLDGMTISYVRRELRLSKDMGCRNRAWEWLNCVRLKSDCDPVLRRARLKDRDCLNAEIDRRCGLRIDAWKQLPADLRKATRKGLRENRVRGQARFRDLPWRWRFYLLLWIFLKNDRFLFRIPSVPGLTAPEASLEM